MSDLEENMRAGAIAQKFEIAAGLRKREITKEKKLGSFKRKTSRSEI